MFIIEVCTDGDALLHFDKIAELCAQRDPSEQHLFNWIFFLRTKNTFQFLLMVYRVSHQVLYT